MCALIVAAAPFVTPQPAGAWSDGPCPTSDGVTVVVDFQGLGGGVHVRCAPGASASGFDALGRAGIDYRTAVRFPGFLCRIADKPSNDPCIDTSPANAYWSYWLAPRGGSWCYSNLGAASRTPPKGTVEGWSFSMSTTGASAPPPGVAAPGRVSGAPTALPSTDCDRSATAPVAPPATSPPVTTPPTTRADVPPPAPGPSGGVASPASGASDAPAPGSEQVAGATSDDPTGDPAIGARVPTSEPQVEAAAQEAEAADGSTPADRRDAARDRSGDDELAAADSVDLSGDGSAGSPVAVLAAGALIAALAAVTIVVRRRAAH
jgi:hypothetical protein